MSEQLSLDIPNKLGFRFLLCLNFCMLDGGPAVTPREGVQNRPPVDVPLGHVNYFELRAIETLKAHEKLLPPP